MEMTEYEICYSYKTAKDKEMQIDILADLNAVSVLQIEKILQKRGVLERNIRESHYGWSKELTDKLIELYNKGYATRFIAMELKCKKVANVQQKIIRLKKEGRLKSRPKQRNNKICIN